ncbi:MAG: glutaredoxin family protein [Gammaproteobacteria bacterium]|nr:glutaredoxin family protein [Gammaproteobacteria bacterium]MDH3856614.1 glutaredoxin family protein [Gammaproteobacteria bacterium]
MKKLHLLIACLALFFFMASPVGSGQLFKWVDDQGNVHYGDSPPENAKLKRITGKVSSYTSVSVEEFVYDPGNITKRTRSKGVVMYSTSWCGYCKKAALHFRKNNIPFTEHDIEKSEQAAKEYKKLNGRGVPIILIGDQRMNGFNATAFDRIYYDKS